MTDDASRIVICGAENLNEFDFIEPSAGSGAFLSRMQVQDIGNQLKFTNTMQSELSFILSNEQFLEEMTTGHPPPLKRVYSRTAIAAQGMTFEEPILVHGFDYDYMPDYIEWLNVAVTRNTHFRDVYILRDPQFDRELQSCIPNDKNIEQKIQGIARTDRSNNAKIYEKAIQQKKYVDITWVNPSPRLRTIRNNDFGEL